MWWCFLLQDHRALTGRCWLLSCSNRVCPVMENACCCCCCCCMGESNRLVNSVGVLQSSLRRPELKLWLTSSQQQQNPHAVCSSAVKNTQHTKPTIPASLRRDIFLPSCVSEKKTLPSLQCRRYPTQCLRWYASPGILRPVPFKPPVRLPAYVCLLLPAYEQVRLPYPYGIVHYTLLCHHPFDMEMACVVGLLDMRETHTGWAS